jgi:hypothetical protein
MIRRFQYGLLALPLLAAAAVAQSNQRVSLQGSALFARLDGKAYTGLAGGSGAELQVRFTPGALSVGAGAQRTSHSLAGGASDVVLGGAFVEPRYVVVIGSDRIAPYVSSRLSFLRQRIDNGQEQGSSSGLTANLGGGLLVRVTRRFNFEAGATFGYTRFGDFTLVNRTTGSKINGPSGSGTNIVLRVGLAAGILK